MTYGTRYKIGEIVLYDRDSPITRRCYNSVNVRNEILTYWRKLYGKTFDKLYYQINPNLLNNA
jgi:hypothetical protein